jgi:hypothetical protein
VPEQRIKGVQSEKVHEHQERQKRLASFEKSLGRTYDFIGAETRREFEAKHGISAK